MKTVLYFSLFVFVSSLFGSCKVADPGPVFFETPPNGILISENFWCDQTEVTNNNWLEFMFWTGRTYGELSQEHLATFPDTSVWTKVDTSLNAYQEYYLEHPAYRNYPVVGISQIQAQNFSKWRSDRVFEYLLVREEVIEFDTLQTKEDHFTIERYFDGKFNGYKPNADVEFYPDYRTPFV